MITVICAVKDSATQAFMQPFFVAHTGLATRSFIDAVNDPSKGNDISRHPADMDLYHIGTFDDATASFVILDAPVRLVRGADVVKPA